jgi:hypothetical protein
MSYPARLSRPCTGSYPSRSPSFVDLDHRKLSPQHTPIFLSLQTVRTEKAILRAALQRMALDDRSRQAPRSTRAHRRAIAPVQNKRGARAEQGQPRSRKVLRFFIRLGAITHRARIRSLTASPLFSRKAATRKTVWPNTPLCVIGRATARPQWPRGWSGHAEDWPFRCFDAY